MGKEVPKRTVSLGTSIPERMDKNLTRFAANGSGVTARERKGEPRKRKKLGPDSVPTGRTDGGPLGNRGEVQHCSTQRPKETITKKGKGMGQVVIPPVY